MVVFVKCDFPIIFLMQRIPKEIVSVLDIPNEGHAALMKELFGIAHRLSSYYTTRDGRICIKDGRPKFASVNGLAVGMDVLILFHKDDNNFLMVTFDVL